MFSFWAQDFFELGLAHVVLHRHVGVAGNTRVIHSRTVLLYFLFVANCCCFLFFFFFALAEMGPTPQTAPRQCGIVDHWSNTGITKKKTEYAD